MNFKPVQVVGKTIDDVWFELLRQLYQHGRKYKIDAGSFAGAYRLEFDQVSGTILEPIRYTDGGVRLPLAVTVPDGVPVPTTDVAIENYFVDYLMDGNLTPNEHYRYSTWIVGGNYRIPGLVQPSPYDPNNIVEHSGFKVEVPDQLHWCINHFKQKGFGNNHCCIQLGYPESNKAYDRDYGNEMERGTSPCMRLLDFKVINDAGINYLCLSTVFRSWDLYAGWPENMGGLALLMEYVAMELEVQVGALSYQSKGLHCYDYQLDPLMRRIGA
jgi:thymidylate synthase